MKSENITEMDRLSLFCHLCGLFTIFLGLMVVFIDLTNEDFRHIQVGFFIFITGYAFVKISEKISKVLFEEKWLQNPEEKEDEK